MEVEVPLLSSFENVINGSKDLMITLLIQGSASMKGDTFETIKNISTNLVEKLDGYYVQLIQYSTITRIECPITNVKSMLVESIQKMNIIGNSSNLAKGITTTKQCYQRVMNENSTPVVILITDGTWTDEDPKDSIQELLNLKPSPKVIGICVSSDPSHQTQLTNMLPGQSVLHISNFIQLNQQIQSLIVKPTSIEPPVRLEFTPGNNDLQRTRSNLTLTFILEALGQSDVIPSGTTLSFLPNEFFYGERVVISMTLKKGQPYLGQVSLELKSQAYSFGEFPEKIWYEIQVGGALYKGSVAMSLGWLTGDLVFAKHPHQELNWLIWGTMGSGKSSIINSFVTVFGSTQEVLKPVLAYRSDRHVTQQYNCYPLSEFFNKDTKLGSIQSQKIKINCWDTWGITEENYKSIRIQNYLQGSIPNGTIINPNLGFIKPDYSRFIHAVLFIIPIGTAQSKTLLNIMAQNIRDCCEFGIKPVLMINYIDTLSSESEIKESCGKIIDASCLNSEDVFIMDNYEHERYRNMEKDLKFLQMMRQLFKESTNSIERLTKAGIIKPQQQSQSPQQYIQSQPRQPLQPQQSYSPSPNSLISQFVQQQQQQQQTNGSPYRQSFYPSSSTLSPTSSRETILTPPVCRNHEQSCPLYGREINSLNTGCPQCSSKLEIGIQSTTRKCMTLTCTSYDKVVTDPAFNNCPNCGQKLTHTSVRSTYSEKRTRQCGDTKCPYHGKELRMHEMVCPICSKPPVLA